jgi:CRISPR-associated protein Csm2
MLRPALLDEEAEQVGRKLAEEKLERTQLRRFYNDVLSLKRRFEMETVREKAKGTPSTADEIFRRIEPELRLLRAKAYYANRRKVLPDIMKTFIDQHIRKISGAKDFQAFCKHFEAVVAFHYAYSKESRKEAEE